MKAIRFGAMALVVLALLAAAACHGFFVSESTTQSVAVTPKGVILEQGDTYNLIAKATTVGGTTTDVTATATWTTSDGTIATVAAGVVTAQTLGGSANTATISAESGGVTGTAIVMVSTTATLPTSLNVTTTGGSTLTISPLTTLQLKATASVSGSDTNVTGLVTWSIPNTTYATVSSSGVITPVAVCGGLLQPTCPTITGTVTTKTGTATGTFPIILID